MGYFYYLYNPFLNFKSDSFSLSLRIFCFVSWYQGTMTNVLGLEMLYQSDCEFNNFNFLDVYLNTYY